MYVVSYLAHVTLSTRQNRFHLIFKPDPALEEIYKSLKLESKLRRNPMMPLGWMEILYLIPQICAIILCFVLHKIMNFFVPGNMKQAQLFCRSKGTCCLDGHGFVPLSYVVTVVVAIRLR